MAFMRLVKQVFGYNTTATDNFTIESTGAGTGQIRKGDLSTSGSTILSWDASGNAQLGKTTNQSMVRLNTANGYGSTNTKIRRFTNVVTNQGTDITYADSATLGATFTINTSGVYAISYDDQFNTNNFFGVSLNSASLTTAVESLTTSEVICMAITTAANYSSSTGSTIYLPAGSIIRAHCSISPSGVAPAYSHFTITRVS